MGFIKEVYSDNRAGLVVVFRQGSTSSNYFDGDSVEAAMKYFNLYLKDNEIFIKTEDETAINNLGIEAKDAEEFRSSVDLILNSLDDEQAIQLPILFPLWKIEVEYKVDERIRYNNKIYKVLQNHTSQENWTPALAPSLFAALLIDEVNGTILEWIQPDSTNPYSNGDKVIHNQKFWISTADNNIWEPGALLTPWKEYIVNWENGVAYAFNQKVVYENITYISLINSNTSLPTDSNYWEEYIEIPDEETIEIFEWTQPDASSAYSIGDKVIFNGEVYESVIDNNVWSPADYPAGWEKIIEE